MNNKIKIFFIILIVFMYFNIYAEKKNTFRNMIDINTMIPLKQNAYNLLWGIQNLSLLSNDETNRLVIVMGPRVYYGSANASVKIERGIAKIFGLYEKKNYLDDDATFRFFNEPDVKLFNLAFLTGINYKIGTIFDHELYVNILLGITIVYMEYIFARFVDENSKIQAGQYFGMLDPEISTEIILRIPEFWFMKKPYIKVAYGIRMVEAVGNIGKTQEIVNYIRIGIGEIIYE